MLRTLRESSTQSATQKTWHGYAISCRKTAALHVTLLNISIVAKVPNVRESLNELADDANRACSLDLSIAQLLSRRALALIRSCVLS